MRACRLPVYAWVVLAIAPAISQSRPIRFLTETGFAQVEVQTPLSNDCPHRFLTAGDSPH